MASINLPALESDGRALRFDSYKMTMGKSPSLPARPGPPFIRIYGRQIKSLYLSTRVLVCIGKHITRARVMSTACSTCTRRSLRVDGHNLHRALHCDMQQTGGIIGGSRVLTSPSAPNHILTRQTRKWFWESEHLKWTPNCARLCEGVGRRNITVSARGRLLLTSV